MRELGRAAGRQRARGRASTARSPAPTWSGTRARRATSTRSTTTRSSPSRPGYPSVFSVGMLQAGILAGFATDWLGAANVRRYAVQFREQVWPGDVVICSGTVDAPVRGRRRAQGRRRPALHPVRHRAARRSRVRRRSSFRESAIAARAAAVGRGSDRHPARSRRSSGRSRSPGPGEVRVRGARVRLLPDRPARGRGRSRAVRACPSFPVTRSSAGSTTLGRGCRAPRAR